MAQRKVPYTVLCDPGEAAYRLYGLGKVTRQEMLNPQVFLRGMQAMLKGHRQALSDQDTKQLPGSFVIDTAGQLVWEYRASHPGDHPPIGSIVAAVDAARVG